jgi:putative transposase
MLQTGCQWRMLPRTFPPRSTVYGYLQAWIVAGVWTHVHVLDRRTRELERPKGYWLLDLKASR